MAVKGIPVVIAENRQGFPVRPVEQNAPLMTVAESGFGTPITISDNGAPFIVQGLVPPWVPEGSDLYADFQNNRYYDGRVRPLASNVLDTHATDILALGSGGYETFAPNVPPITDLGLLTTVGRTNLAFPSSDFSSGWSLSGATLTPNDRVSPLASDLADKVTHNNSSLNQGPFRVLSIGGNIAGKTLTTSLFVYSETAFTGTIRVRGQGSVQEAQNYSVNITANSWTRISATKTFTASADGTQVYFGFIPDFGVSTNIPARTYWVWGAQLEEAPFATDPIITEGSAGTRPGNMPVVPVPDGPRAAVLDFDLLQPAAIGDGIYRRLLSWNDGSPDNHWEAFFRPGDGRVGINNRSSGVSYAEATTAGSLVQGRNIIYLVASGEHRQIGIAGVGDSGVASDGNAPVNIDTLGVLGRGLSATENTYGRARQFAEIRNITDPAAAFAQAKSLAQEWAS